MPLVKKINEPKPDRYDAFSKVILGALFALLVVIIIMGLASFKRAPKEDCEMDCYEVICTPAMMYTTNPPCYHEGVHQNCGHDEWGRFKYSDNADSL